MNIVAGTSLEGIQIMMTHNQCFGIPLLQIAEQHLHSTFLCLCAGIPGFSPAVESALVAHADGVFVVVPAVGTHLLLMPPRPDHSFAVDIVMVADVFEPAMRYVVAPTFRECEPLPLPGG